MNIANDSKYVYLGFVAKAFGIKGGIAANFCSGSCNLNPGDNVFLVFNNNTQRSFVIKSVMMPNRIFFESIEDRNQAELLKNAKIYKIFDDLKKLPDDEYYLTQLQNFNVINEENITLGTVIGFSSNNAQDLLEIKHTLGHIFYIPLVKELVINIDFAKSLIIVKSLEGLDCKD